VNIGSAVSGATSTITLNGTVNAPGLANGVKAWVNFNGTGTVAIRASSNVSSITDNGTGDYTVNFTTAMADANYAMSGFAGDALFSVGVTLSSWGTYTQTTSAFRFKVYYSGSTVVDTTNILATFIR
jgi:multidrug efflux pump subunit AcrA (membrane-fusion protein)